MERKRARALKAAAKLLRTETIAGRLTKNLQYDKTRRIDTDYGTSAAQPALTLEQFNGRKNRHYERLHEYQPERVTIEKQTVGQNNNKWKVTRRNLLTAANFGKICRMRETTTCATYVKSILYSHSVNALATRYGKRYEPIARGTLEAKLGRTIYPCGLIIDPEIPGLGASPDGIIDEDTLVEIKYLYSAKRYSIEDAISKKLPAVYKIFKNGDITKVNKRHEYYYQMQGQLHIVNRKYCEFLLWTPHSNVHLTIKRDDNFWKTKMEPLLIEFYNNCLVPEIIDPQYPYGNAIKDPEYITEAQTRIQKLKNQKKKK